MGVMGLHLFLAIVEIVVAIILLFVIFMTTKLKRMFATLGVVVIVVASVAHFKYIDAHEGTYYKKHANLEVRYGQVKSKSDLKISIYKNGEQTDSSNFTLENAGAIEGIHEGDVVKIIYVDGIYRAYAIEIEKYVPASK
jgi:hypothetical protein